MRLLKLIVAVLVFCLPVASNAHEVGNTDFSPFASIDDLNAIAAIAEKGEWTKGDVRYVSNVSCGTFRVALQNLVLENTQNLQNEFGYPSEEELFAIELEEFVSFEVEAFREAGATDITLALLSGKIADNFDLPKTTSLVETEPVPVVQAIEDAACTFRNVQPDELSEPATPEETEFGEALGDAVLGLGAIVVDGWITTQSGGLAAGVLGIASGGWGWNRIEEAAPTIFERLGRILP
ncbi:hypothetical protein RA27_10125 [Ruegeria sp. ANG-R]|uniref:hypothetical protein n=1 Tax=Ruegeria sp. ANG-R TaxID=1577903 RepID=UPI00057D5551|nr:hypothetical protein [Ruegeria sp. ANG-R]KIC41584.1 hypothetical protein RA27_10125 [Ruegeria sp. ANG-R]